MDPDTLLHRSATAAVDGAVDHRGLPVFHSASGGWTSALFIIGVEIAERFTYYGVSSNLMTYLTGPLGESTAAAAANVNAWSGAAMMLPLLGAFIADSWLGRYRTIVGASLLYILGLGMLSLSAEISSFHPPKCSEGALCPPDSFQVTLFFSSIYLISFAQGGHKPCVQAFGADQFDENDPGECKSKSSFFNWWYFGLCCGGVVAILILNFVQENISWALGFEIPFVSMVVALSVFLLGTKTYRFYMRTSGRPPPPPRDIENAVKISATEDGKNLPVTSERSVFVNADDGTTAGQHSSLTKRSKLVRDSRPKEDLMAVLKLFPIWATCLVYAIVCAQSTTFFTKQGSTMDRRIGKSLLVPPAALQSFIGISIITVIPIYDLILIPVARKFTGIPSGLTLLQRVGIGMFLSTISMVVAAVVEMKRLQTARDYGLVDSPKVPIPMSLWWLLPQYVIGGVADVFTKVGLQEFFYDQVPDRFRSVGLALYLCTCGFGSFISSFLVSLIDEYTGRSGGDSWFCNNLNRGHLDYFYWLLAGLSAAQVLIYVYLSQAYQYKKKSICT